MPPPAQANPLEGYSLKLYCPDIGGVSGVPSLRRMRALSEAPSTRALTVL
jgi:hypothetical protein